ncbi:hypothetical protein EMIHUDRAFT_444120, partial [Emiliania huxleyi CCMP1516]
YTPERKYIYAHAQARCPRSPRVFDRRSQGREAGREARSEAARRRERGRRHHRRCALPVRQRRPPGPRRRLRRSLHDQLPGLRLGRLPGQVDGRVEVLPRYHDALLRWRAPPRRRPAVLRQGRDGRQALLRHPHRHAARLRRPADLLRGADRGDAERPLRLRRHERRPRRRGRHGDDIEPPSIAPRGERRRRRERN